MSFQTARQPRLHAAETTAKMDRVPKNDSDIMPKQRQSKSPRHATLADEMRPLLDWRRLSNPNSGTWAKPANDNLELTLEGQPPNTECELEQRPSPEELERAWKTSSAEAALRIRPKDKFGTPKGPDERDRPDREKESANATKKRKERALAIEALKYILQCVQGEPIEPAENRDPQFTPGIWESYETSAKLAARDLLSEFGVGREVPFEEAQKKARLGGVANDNRPVFPWLPKDPRAIFFSGKVRPHATHREWYDWADAESNAEAERHEFAHLRGKLSSDAVKVLDIAVEAQNFAKVGEAFGFKGKTAERQGKKLVLAACAELKSALANR